MNLISSDESVYLNERYNQTDNTKIYLRVRARIAFLKMLLENFFFLLAKEKKQGKFEIIPHKAGIKLLKIRQLHLDIKSISIGMEY